MIAGLSVLADMPKFGECYIINATFMGSEEKSSYWSVQFFSAFLWSPSIGKCCLTPASDYEVSLVIIGRLPMNLTRFANLVIIWVVHFLERTDLITTLGQTMRAVCIYFYSSG